jgi:transposase-like protein
MLVAVIAGTLQMVLAPMHCPTCHSIDVVKHGKPSDRKHFVVETLTVLSKRVSPHMSTKDDD